MTLVQRLREQAAGELAPGARASRFACRRARTAASSAPPREEPEREGPGRSVPLGAAQVARAASRPRHAAAACSAIPHPDVIRRCLANPRLVEDDVIRLARAAAGPARRCSARSRARAGCIARAFA